MIQKCLPDRTEVFMNGRWVAYEAIEAQCPSCGREVQLVETDVLNGLTYFHHNGDTVHAYPTQRLVQQALGGNTF